MFTISCTWACGEKNFVLLADHDLSWRASVADSHHDGKQRIRCNEEMCKENQNPNFVCDRETHVLIKTVHATLSDWFCH